MEPSARDEFFGEVISTYSRAEAIEDGELLDVSEAAKTVGIPYPVAMTCAAYVLCVELSPAAERACQDERGRLHDVVWMLRNEMQRANVKQNRLTFKLLCVTRSTRPSFVELRAVCGPGDTADPVITILLPEES
jgi:hypothetical protein